MSPATQANAASYGPTLYGTGNEYRPKCDDALRLRVKAEWINVCVAGKTVVPLTCAILTALEMSFAIKC